MSGLEPYLSPTRVYQAPGIDSTRWAAYVPRADDIIISTAPKSGTTWLQAIVRELIVHAMHQAGVTDPAQFPAPDNISSLWPEFLIGGGPLDELQANLAAQPHRRFLKSHLALDGLPIYRQVKYLIMARDQRDVFMSSWNFYKTFTDERYALINSLPGRVGEPFPRCPEEIHDYWAMWIQRGVEAWEQQGYPFASSMHHVRSWWDYRHLDNIFLLHYADMKRNPAGEISRIANFLEITISDEAIAKIIDTTSLGAMRQRGITEEAKPDAQISFPGGAKNFFYKGTNGRWQGLLTEAELTLYEQVQAKLLTPDCAHWLELGRVGMG